MLVDDTRLGSKVPYPLCDKSRILVFKIELTHSIIRDTWDHNRAATLLCLHHHGGTESLAEFDITCHRTPIVMHSLGRPLVGCDFETTFAVEVVCPMHIDSLGSVLKQICGVQAEGVRRAR